jgi:pyruvate-ferredoxin/flavodoxin oxidoreductase
LETIRTLDGNEAAAYVAHKTNEVIAIYPITPASPMGEWADKYTARSQPNIWGSVPTVIEMQAEGGAAGAVHGALQAGSLTTTFTASQGLLLMIPNMYKIAGELSPTVFHIAARSLAAQALSIFCDHSDVMAARGSGWAMLFGNSVQEAHDFALISQAATLASRVPFLHVFDGFRTSHEIAKINMLSDDTLRAMIDDDLVRAFRSRALTPDAPVIRGTAQNPDVYFQAREAANPYYLAVPGIVEETFAKFAELTGREYALYEYVGAPDAERVIVLMGSGAETTEETVDALLADGEKVGVLKVRLFRPFAASYFLDALPETVKALAVLDRTKEPGSIGEPLYQDVITALAEGVAEGTLGQMPKIVGGRYGLSSKEFTPGMVKAIFDELTAEAPRNHFTIGINDDVTHTSLAYDPSYDIEPDDVVRAVFWGLGSDGTVGANKNNIKIIGEETDFYAQGYFVYDSKKSGARTISHLRFGPRPIRSEYLIKKAGFVGIHQFGFLTRYDVLSTAQQGATVLLNSPYPPDDVWDELPRSIQQTIIERDLTLYVIDAYTIAREVGLGVRINTIMQTCFFALSGVLPRDEAIAKIKEAIRKSYGKRGETIVQMNYLAVDSTLENLYEVPIPEEVTSDIEVSAAVPAQAPAFVQDVTAPMLAGHGDALPVSAMPDDGTFPTGTTKWEKRNIALEVPVWDPDVCIQCGKCVMSCPHAVIRSKVYDADLLGDAPEGFQAVEPRWRGMDDAMYTLQVAVEDCTGCKLCVEVCPAKNKSQAGRKAINMEPQLPIREQEVENWDFFLELPEYPTGADLSWDQTKNVQLLEPLFEFSGACAGCGETPYLSLMTRLFGDRALVANATGCSSIYGGNMPTTPWATDAAGRGPAWSNSLFEDNAEFGLGMRLAVDKQAEYAHELVATFADTIGVELATTLRENPQLTDAQIAQQREAVERLQEAIADIDTPQARDLKAVANYLVKKSVWIVGGDGWAYDIGYGGLDHVLASGWNVNLLVLDTEVYSNTGGQASKATPLGAVAKFAAGGKPTPKKDLGRMAMTYGDVYVAQIAMGANDRQTIKAFLEAESFDGPSLIIAYSHCIAHGIDMAKGFEQQELASKTGYWPLYRYDPRLIDEAKNPFQLDSRKPRKPLQDYIYNEARYRILQKANPAAAEQYLQHAQAQAEKQWAELKALADKE